MTEHEHYPARKHPNLTERLQLRTIQQQSPRAAPQVSDSTSDNALQRAAQLREKAAAAEQRAASAMSPNERAFYQAESVNYQALAVEVEKLGRTAQRLDAKGASITEGIASMRTKSRQPANDRGASIDEVAPVATRPSNSTGSESPDYEPRPSKPETLGHLANETTAADLVEARSVVAQDRQPATYWYVASIDAPFDFFRGQEKITEEEWRREAPADVVAALDAEGFSAG